MQIGPKRVARGSYGPPCHVPRWYWRYWTGSTPRTSATANSRKVGQTKSVVAQRGRGADLRGLLALEARVDGQLALTLQGDAFAVEAPRQDHPAEQLAEPGGVEPDVRIADGGAVGSEDALRRRAGPVRGRLLLGVGHG